MKHLEVRQKYSAARRIFNSLLGVSSGDETLLLMFDILLLALCTIGLFVTNFRGFPRKKVPEFKSINNKNKYIKDPLALILKCKIKNNT